MWKIYMIFYLITLSNTKAEEGKCSWYGAEGEIAEGWPTACGNGFARMAMAAAHKTIPCGTKVKVTNKADGQSIIVTIDDRGPFVAGRILDLNYGAALQMGFIEKGLIDCKIETV